MVCPQVEVLDIPRETTHEAGPESNQHGTQREHPAPLTKSRVLLDLLLFVLPAVPMLILPNFLLNLVQYVVRSRSMRWGILLRRAIGSVARFKANKKKEEIDHAVTCLHEALSLSPQGGFVELLSLVAMGHCLHTRYQDFWDMDDIQTAISCLKKSLPLSFPAPWHSTLNYLSVCLEIRYRQLGDIQDLEEAIQYNKYGLVYCPPTHPNRSTLLNNLSACLETRFKDRGDFQDLKEAIQCNRDGLRLYPTRHNDRSTAISNLASCLEIQFIYQGDIQSLEEAIQCNREALLLCESGHPNQLTILGNLSTCLETWYQHQGDIQQLEEAIQCGRDALKICPSGHPNQSTLFGNLGNFLGTWYLQKGNIQALDDSIQSYSNSLEICPLGHKDRPTTLNNLATFLETRYRNLGQLQDLTRAIQCIREVLELRPPGNPDGPSSLSILADGLVAQCSDTRDIEEAVRCLEEAIKLSPQDHPLLANFWTNLAVIYADHSKDLQSSGSSEDVTRLFAMATDHPTASFQYQFSASLVWISREIARGGGPSLLQAYSKSLELADQYILVQSSIVTRHRRLSTIPHSLALDAAATAIWLNKLEKAVEFLEQGRTLLWSQLGRYRISLHALREANKELADEFERLSKLLESSAIPRGSNKIPRKSMEDEARTYRRVSDSWRDTVDEIRKLDSFSMFLLPTPFDTLKQASINGPIIIINISAQRSDAIIVQHNIKPLLLPLPNTRPDDISHLYSEFTRAIRSEKPSRKVMAVLRSLWEDIAGPIAAKLQEINIEHGSRIWWCATSKLAMLPLHAAGIWPRRENRPNLPDIYVSSYTTTLSALLRSSQTYTEPHASSLLLVAQPEVPGQPVIPSVFQELQKVKDVVPSVDVLLGEEGTPDTVLAGLRTHPWVHFTCHGSQDALDPFNSCLHLYGKSLAILDIVQAQLANAQYAFLAACHSAAGDTERPDETIHMAAALQFCGFQSVIGTMYPMADIDGPVLAEEVYRHMFRRAGEGTSDVGGPVADHKDAAKALNVATKSLRNRGIPVERWINFVHIGA